MKTARTHQTRSKTRCLHFVSVKYDHKIQLKWHEQLFIGKQLVKFCVKKAAITNMII